MAFEGEKPTEAYWGTCEPDPLLWPYAIEN